MWLSHYQLATHMELPSEWLTLLNIRNIYCYHVKQHGTAILSHLSGIVSSVMVRSYAMVLHACECVQKYFTTNTCSEAEFNTMWYCVRTSYLPTRCNEHHLQNGLGFCLSYFRCSPAPCTKCWVEPSPFLYTCGLIEYCQRQLCWEPVPGSYWKVMCSHTCTFYYI